MNGILAQYNSNPSLSSVLPNLQTQLQNNMITIAPSLQALAQQTTINMVQQVIPAQAGTLSAALNEIIQEMNSASQTVKSCNISITANPISSNTGNGVIVSSTKRGDGRVNENAFPETLRVTCSLDAQTGGQSAGSESFTLLGGLAESSPWMFDWPNSGSGANLNLTAVNGNLSAGSNYLTNSGFENFINNQPSNWVIETGTTGTDILASTRHYDSGTSSLQFAGTGALSAISQTFNSSSGTPINLAPQRSYALNFWTEVDVVPASGVLVVELVSSANQPINDDQGILNQWTLNLNSLSANSWTAQNMVFRVPHVLPAGIKLRLRLSSAISSGSNLFIDRLAMTPLTSAYPGGPGLAIFSGSINFVQNDGWNLVVSNDRGGQTYGATFQTLFDRLFNMRSLNLLLPSAATPTIADTLITV